MLTSVRLLFVYASVLHRLWFLPLPPSLPVVTGAVGIVHGVEMHCMYRETVHVRRLGSPEHYTNNLRQLLNIMVRLSARLTLCP